MSDTNAERTANRKSATAGAAPTEHWDNAVKEISADFAAASNDGKNPRIADYLARIGKPEARAKGIAERPVPVPTGPAPVVGGLATTGAAKTTPRADASRRNATEDVPYTGLPQQALFAQLLVCELRQRIRAGDCPTSAEYQTEFPEFAEQVQKIFQGQAQDGTPRRAFPTVTGLDPLRIGTEKPADFGDYELMEELGRGGMGVVYKARQKSLGRTVALKMILAGSLASEREVQRFLTEAAAAAKLDHPGIVPVYETGRCEVGQNGSGYFYSMAFVEGESLSQKLESGPLPPRRAAELIEKTAEAVAYAHGRGVIHRDLKPANILLDSQDRPRVTDFGLAKHVESGTTVQSDGTPRTRSTGYPAFPTMTGQIVGTPSYMPPEQAAGKIAEIGPAADVYALGATLYALVTGRPPFQAASAAETLQLVLNQEPVPPRQLNPTVDKDLETICVKCLQKEPAQRYASAAELSADLARYLDGRPIHARPISAPARLLRWSRRNPRYAITAAALALSLLAGTAISTFFAFRSANNADFYRKEKLRADGETAKAKAALEETEKTIDKYGSSD